MSRSRSRSGRLGVGQKEVTRCRLPRAAIIEEFVPRRPHLLFLSISLPRRAASHIAYRIALYCIASHRITITSGPETLSSLCLVVLLFRSFDKKEKAPTHFPGAGDHTFIPFSASCFCLSSFCSFACCFLLSAFCITQTSEALRRHNHGKGTALQAGLAFVSHPFSFLHIRPASAPKKTPPSQPAST